MTKNSKIVTTWSVESILREARKRNGTINTVEKLFKHIDRLQKCSECGRSFYDKPCPDCIIKEIRYHGGKI